MIFEVTRSSDIYNKREKPCENCFPLELTNVERLEYASVLDCNQSHREQPKWTEEGTNHRIINNKCYRDNGTVQTWGVRIDTLKELMEFKNEIGEELILGISTADWRTPCIEIYDDLKR